MENPNASHDVGESQAVITSLEDRQEPLLRWLTAPTVTDEKQQHDAENLLIAAKAALKEAEEKRKELTRPLDDSKARIIALFKPYTDRLSKGINALTTELGKYYNTKRIKAEAARLTALAEEAARIRAAEGTGEIMEPLARPVVPAVAKTSRTDLGTVSYREHFDIQIIEPKEVPRDLCEPSMPKIRARVNSGVLHIPGVLVSRKIISITRGRISGKDR